MAKRYEELTPEQRARVDAIRARRRTTEARAEEEQVRERVMEEFPPARTASAELMVVVDAMRAERQRRDLSLADVAERSGLGRAMLCRLENGQVPNPTVDTLRRYASALNKRLAMAVRDAGSALPPSERAPGR